MKNYIVELIKQGGKLSLTLSLNVYIFGGLYVLRYNKNNLVVVVVLYVAVSYVYCITLINYAITINTK